MAALDQRITDFDAADIPTTNDSPLDDHRVRDPREVLPEVEMPGKAAPTSGIGKGLANQLFGDAGDRATIEKERKDALKELYQDGRAAPVTISANGRELRGNFFSVAGHNLRGNDFQVDTTRPAVLLLTGSHGSAEDQGFDVASFYAGNGANVLSVNYGGFGGSDANDVGELTVNQDGQAMLEYLVGLGYDPENIILHGFSMGATVAAQLEAQYESNGICFRGQVQDRPMPSANDGVIGHSTILGRLGGAALAKRGLGRMSGKKALLELSNPATRKVVATEGNEDEKGEFAKRGESMRDKLVEAGHQVTGTSTGGDHMDHEAMLETHRDPLLDLVRIDLTGQQDWLPPQEDPYLQQIRLLDTTIEVISSEIKEAYRPIFSELTLGENAEHPVDERRAALERAWRRMLAVEDGIEQFREAGGDALRRYNHDSILFAGYARNIEDRKQRAINAFAEIEGATSETLGELALVELNQLLPRIQELTTELNTAGGPAIENSPLEDEILRLAKRCHTLETMIEFNDHE
ncbi:hypothetical protein NB063_04625 [Rhodopirellula sp. ICT_H3.1]|uniref:Alpha/beta hydrolase n=1 Tax=Aporhodopirellula aestuarii TaxID=2950107 RepID=A0ABT0TZ64_9BACT|nr:hypothetical protein [Aporhodopirellula aestuarii]